MKTLIAAVAAALVGTAAFAQTSGKEQLARSLGVNPDDYTLNELAQLAAARSDDEDFMGDVLAMPSQSMSREQKAQLAAGLGVDPDLYTVAELAALKTAQTQENDTLDQMFRMTDVQLAMKQQLAAQLGVDPGEFTLAELARMIGQSDDTDDN